MGDGCMLMMMMMGRIDCGCLLVSTHPASDVLYTGNRRKSSGIYKFNHVCVMEC